MIGNALDLDLWRRELARRDRVEFARHLGGDPAIRHVVAQATRYRPGQSLMPHDDEDASEQHRCAFVLDLGPDGSGQLQVLDRDARVPHLGLPRRNALRLFRLPQRHQAPFATPWAATPRHAS
jgi:SM-20-related protein